MNKQLADWTFKDLEYFLSENDLSMWEVIALLGSGMIETVSMAHQSGHKGMIEKYGRLIPVIMSVIVKDLGETFSH